MKTYNVLVVDDSAFMRKAISNIIEQDPELNVVGIARNGIDAIEKIKRLKPDLVTLDIDMPEMDGITALEEIMKDSPLPVIMLSNVEFHQETSPITCMELGAIDFFVKDKLFNETEHKEVEFFLEKLKAATKAKLVKNREVVKQVEVVSSHSFVREGNERLIIIGCSTGGPSALQSILPNFPEDFPIPIVIIQHMPKGFTKPLADRLNTICHLHVKEVELDGEEIIPGNIYIDQAGLQTSIIKKNGKYIFSVNCDSPIPTLYHPSVDVMLLSAASLYGSKLLTVILTGMGQDGLFGCKEVSKYGGRIIVEDEETCVVYGMPKVIFEEGIADIQAPLYKIFDKIQKYS